MTLLRLLPLLLVLFTILCGNLANRAFANDQPIFGPKEEVFFKYRYRNFEKNKAIAIGPDGYIHYAYGYTSAKEAKSVAINMCNREVEKERKKKRSGGWCLLYAVNDKTVWTGSSPGIPSNQELPLPDRPLIQGQIFGDSSTARNILLFLHGCDHLSKPPPEWVMSWVEYFTARDFLVVAPDSFADPHPEICGDQAKADYAVTTEVDRLRIAQAKRTLRQLTKTYPGKPIYIWGHSGGARTVQSFSPKVEGVIVSGDECGLRDKSIVVIPSSVPILYVFGEKDPFLERLGKTVTAKSAKSHCSKSKGDRRWVIVKDTNHYTAIWHQNVIETVSKFVKRKSFQLKPQIFAGDAGVPVKKAFDNMRKYGSQSWAIAINANNEIFISNGMQNEVDAVQSALRRCSLAAGLTPYPAAGAHTCKIYSPESS